MNKAKHSVIFVIFAVIFICIAVFQPREKRDAFNEKEAEKLLNLDIESDYPAAALNVIQLNNQYVSFLYGGNVKEEEVRPLLEKQTILWDERLLEINPLDEMTKIITEEIQNYKDISYRLLATEILETVTDVSSTDTCEILVKQFTNAEQDNIVRYYLQKSGGERWKILGWNVTQTAKT